MAQRIETRTIDTGEVAQSVLVQRNPCLVHWIALSPIVKFPQGLVQIYDGFDTGGKLKWQAESGEARICSFIPPFRCEQGLFIYTDTKVSSWTVAYETRARVKPGG